MTRVVGVRFKRASKIYYFDPANLNLKLGDEVIVETARGIELGEVAVRPKQIPPDDVPQPLKKVLRQATQADIDTYRRNAIRGKEAYVIALERILSHDLPMKLVDAEYTFDENKVVFYFSADKRVDFRELVKDLAARFRSRVELRQIGVRDEAKFLGGYGICGRPLCCSTWISDFEPVSIRHAKEQDLSLNPGKISGVCGRLKCCLRFEVDTYRQIRNDLPKVGDIISTRRGSGKVVDVLITKESVLVQLPDSGERVEVHLRDIVASKTG